jgi:phenylacetic acid degradation operon negative regulatory protein
VTAKTELLLYRMGWLASKAMRPTFRSLDQSFEGWAYANGFLAQIQRLEAQGYIESMTDERSGKRLHRLTEAGRKVAAGPRDPETAWATSWDGKWRLFLFDVPEKDKSKRRHLTRALSSAGCGCIQGSTWISPCLPPTIEKLMADNDPQCSHMMMLHAESKGRSMDLQMVEAAWDFDAINRLYEDYLAVLAELKAHVKSTSREEFAAWGNKEIAVWRKALAADPLLPEELLPKGYLGRKAFDQRQKSQSTAAGILAQIWPSE